MDPTTTLVTFMLQTHPSVKTVTLVGSWDNFSKHYTMERDSRRGRGQWKGCYSYKDITCDDDTGVGSKRNGGLKMGHSYYYYYELDGSYETHDSTRPSTNLCPYMPGQTVNTLQVPVEQSLRKRSASLSSMRNNDFMTMNPDDKFITPRPAPPVPGQSVLRLGSSSDMLRHKASARSLSPTPTWRRFFRKSSRDERDSVSYAELLDDARSVSSGGSSRSRDISPESLRRFLCDDTIPLSPSEDRPSVLIPEDIAEENEDDDNFATSATSENMAFATCLSPPPFRRTESSNTVSSTAEPISMTFPEHSAEDVPESPVIPRFDFGPSSRFSFSSVSSYTPSEAVTPEAESPSFYDSLDEDVLTDCDASQPLSPVASKQLEQSYSLPTAESSKAPLLPSPIDGGVDDLVAELSWMMHAISGKTN